MIRLFILAAIYPAIILLAGESAQAAKLTGSVVDIEGNAVPDATVWVTQQRRVRTVETGADGTFTAPDIDVALTEVVGYKPGYALGGATALVVGDATVEIVLAPGDLITVKVLDVQSNPVAGATVRSMVVSGSFVVSVEDLVSHGLPPIRSDDQGILTVAPLPAGGHVRLNVGHPRYANATIRYLPVDPEQRNILLREGRRVAGRITHNGRGVEDARVSIFKHGAGGQKEFAEALTDREGFYHARVEPGHYGVAVQHLEYASPAPTPLEVPARGEAPAVNIGLETARIIDGEIQYPDKKPCGGVRVMYRKDDAILQDTYTNNDGVFRLRVPGGPGEIAIVPPPGFRNPHVGSIPVDLGEVTEFSLNPIQLKALPVIAGTFQDKDGENPGPVLVTIKNLPVRYSLLTDENGEFSLPLDFMPAVETLHLRAEHTRRFQAAEVEIDMEDPAPFQARLKPFDPDLAPRKPLPGINNLSGLVGKAAKPWQGDTWINSDPITLDELKGNVVVLFFWAGFDRDLGPVALRHLLTVYRALDGVDDVKFVGIHDAISSSEEIEEYLSSFEIPFPVLRDSDEQTIFSAYNIVRIPQIVLLDKMGKVRYYQVDDRLLSCIKGLRRE